MKATERRDPVENLEIPDTHYRPVAEKTVDARSVSLRYQIGIDIGGTFTDFVLVDSNGTIRTLKIPSTPADYNEAISSGLEELLASSKIESSEVARVIHATTVATNALLQHRGATVGLLTTSGFRDVLEIRRGRMPVLYDLNWRPPKPLVPRHLRREVPGRISADGRTTTPLDRAAVAREVRILLDEGVDCIAVALINAHANSGHEEAVASIVREIAPSTPLCLSSEVLPEIREYERTSTTVVNAYLGLVVGDYLRRFEDGVARRCKQAQLSIIQSSGGLATIGSARARPVDIIESGPAAGVVAAAAIARQLNLDRVIAFDMGGTTAKAAIVSDGKFGRVSALDVGDIINHGSRLLQGRGYHVSVPAIDIAEVGAGAGSLVRLDKAGGITIGPESSGADPGPVCYGRGGEVPTVTDANVSLGYLNGESLVGGKLAINKAAAVAAIESILATPLGMETIDVALGIHRVASASVARAVKAVTSEQGKDPRDYALIAFGGSGPVHAAAVAKALRIATIIVPPASGVLSALGLLFAEPRRHVTRSVRADLETADYSKLAEEFAACEVGDRIENDRVERTAGMRYAGEDTTLFVHFPDFGPDWRPLLKKTFAAVHHETFGYDSPDERIKIVSIRSSLSDATAVTWLPERLSYARHSDLRSESRRAVYFGAPEGWIDTAVVARDDISTTPRAGPLIVEEYETTIVVPPDYTIARMDWDVLIMNRISGSAINSGAEHPTNQDRDVHP